MPIANARGGRIAGLLVSAAAVLASGVVGCTSVTGGDAAVDALEAPAYRSSVAASSSQSAASSSARTCRRSARAPVANSTSLKCRAPAAASGSSRSSPTHSVENAR